MPSEAREDEIRARLDQRRYTEAFELAVSVFGDRMFRLAYSILGDRTMAEDAVQDVMIRVWQALPAFRGDAAVSTWIYAVTRNQCLTILKRGARGRTISLDDPAVRPVAELRPMPELASPGHDLLRLVEELPRPYREVLTLFYMQEKSYDEIARMLNLPIGTVKTHLYRGKKALAAMVRDRE